MTAALDLQISHAIITCCHKDCGIAFSVPTHWNNRRREDGTWWYCPNGHQQHYTGHQLEIDRLNAQLAEERDATKRAREQRDRAERRLAAQKGVLTRIKRRAHAGVCPVAGCKQHFTNLHRHMQTKHPDWRQQEIE